MSYKPREEIHYKIWPYPAVYHCLVKGGCDGHGIKRETSRVPEIYCTEELCKMDLYIKKDAYITLKS